MIFIISGEKPFQCNQCENKGFTTLHSLKNHKNRHNKEENKQVENLATMLISIIFTFILVTKFKSLDLLPFPWLQED